MEFGYVYVDVETTGLNSSKDEIVEVSVIEFNLSNVRGDKIIQLCKPMSGRIPPDATAVHGITYDQVKDMPTYLTGGIRERIAKFVGKRVLVGHNVLEFDIGFLKIKPLAIEDTLKMCREKRGKGGNKLKSACRREGIEWDDNKSHRAEYDCDRGIELFIKLKNKESAAKSKSSAPLFDGEVKETQEAATVESGIIPTAADKSMMATQSYSYSRISLFLQCPFKWFMKYVRRQQEPPHDYFQIGKACHKVAEWAGEWCFREFFINKFAAYCEKKEVSIPDGIVAEIFVKFGTNPADVSFRDYGAYLHDNQQKIKEYTDCNGLATLSNKIDKDVRAEEFERPSIPDRETYDQMVQGAINKFGCTDPGTVSEIVYITNSFYRNQNFSLIPGEVTVTERKLAFDKDWNVIGDFFSPAAFFRGIIDVVHFYEGATVVVDYKTSRKMDSVKDLQNDMQLKCYVLLLYKYMPKGYLKRVIVRITYVRYGQTVECAFEDAAAVAEEATKWINDSIQQIELEVAKTDGDAFMPKRNEYCHSCYLAEDGKCPLFNKSMVGLIGDANKFVITDASDCERAWKRVEANKAENARLTKICKAFVESTDGRVSVDGQARLDFYIEKKREYDPELTLKWLLEHKVDIRYAIKFFSISPSSFETLLEKKELEINEDSLNEISKEKTSSRFDAFTEDEALEKGFLNASFPDPK